MRNFQKVITEIKRTVPSTKEGTSNQDKIATLDSTPVVQQFTNMYMNIYMKKSQSDQYDKELGTKTHHNPNLR